MNKEELKKEAIQYAIDYPTSYGNGYKHKDLRIAYLASAEPREKRITDLEKENAELKDKLESAEDMIKEIVTNKAVIKVCSPYADIETVKSLEIVLDNWFQRAEQFLKEMEK